MYNQDQFSQETRNKVLHCFWVDDCLVLMTLEDPFYHVAVPSRPKSGFLTYLSGSATDAIIWLLYLAATVQS